MSIELAQDRVAAFIASHDEWEGAEQDYIQSTGTYRSEGAVKLFKSDLRDVVVELEEHQSILLDIDKALDRVGSDSAFDVLDAIRVIMGRNSYNEEV